MVYGQGQYQEAQAGIPVQRWPAKFAVAVGESTRQSIAWLFALGLIVMYVPLLLSAIVFDVYITWVSTVVVLFTALIAVVTTAWVAMSNLPWLHENESERRRENRGWGLITAGSAIALITNVAYAWGDLTGSGVERNGLLTEALVGLAFLCMFAGLASIPWAQRKIRHSWSKLNVVIVLIAVGTLFWPLLFGPILAGNLEGYDGLSSLSNYFTAVFFLISIILWTILHDARKRLQPIAIAFVVAILSLVVVQAGSLGLLNAEGMPIDRRLALLLVNGASVLAFLCIALAGFLRVGGSIQRHHAQATEDVLTSDTVPIPFWQLVAPYPILMVLIVARMGSELLGWDIAYRPSIVGGVGVLLVLLMFKHIPMLRFNQELHQRLASATIRDGLTGLYSHRALHDLLHTEVARTTRRDEKLAVLFMDIDRFKSFNDTYGHLHGDEVIVSVAEILKKCCRSSDLVGRYGGEEFMIIAPGIDQQRALRMAERIRSAMSSRQFTIGGDRVSITLSIGVVLYPDGDSTSGSLIDLADQAMYRAKQAGGNRISEHDPSLVPSTA